MGPKKTLFLDEISTGLDSSTTFQITRTLRDFSHLRQATMLVALLQPTPETYNLFDDCSCLKVGTCICAHAQPLLMLLCMVQTLFSFFSSAWCKLAAALCSASTICSTE